ncbi:MAG TPA: hypothetical protein VH207_15610 [Chthoniobacterales bacterium]|jgi:hypothetical protein|nr:hypothetical protein [Chthoniobacterales bacterium]
MQTPAIFHRPKRFLWLVPLFALPLAATMARADDSKSIEGFTKAIIELGPGVDPAEARMISETAHHTARDLQKKWRVFPFALVQNFLIHVGARDRGFCFHWAHGIGMELKKLPLQTLDLHWAEAYASTHLEHNVVVVTARGQPIQTGYIIDGWRAAGRLLWWPVTKDEYPWRENPAYTAWLENTGPDPLAALNRTAQQTTAPKKARGKTAGEL